MKKILFGIILLCTLSLAFAETASKASEKTQGQETLIGNVQSDVLLESPTASHVRNSSPVMSKTEADTLRAHEGRLLATSNMEGVKVGNVGSNDLIYILVVVLLVVVIIAVI